MNQKSKTIIILANGSYPKHKIPLQYLSSKNKIIFCDGAINNLNNKNINPYKIIGDLDSISKVCMEKYKDIITLQSEQNNNDLYKALNWCYNNDYSNIVILGASGKRDDHFIGNIFLLFEFTCFLNLKMITDTGIFIIINKNTIFKSYVNQPVSFFAIDNTIKVKTENLKYPLNNTSLKNLFSGTLNVSISNTFKIDISHGSLLVFQKHKKNNL